MPAANRSSGQSNGVGNAMPSVSSVVAARPVRVRLGASMAGSRGSQRPDPRLQRAQHRAAQVAEVVRARQPARAAEVDDAVVQHHRQDRREGEAADAHRHAERDQAGDGEPERAQAGRSMISTQFGFAPDRLLAALGERAGRRVDGVAAEPVRGLADGDQAAAVGREREAARLGLGRRRPERRERAGRRHRRQTRPACSSGARSHRESVRRA